MNALLEWMFWAIFVIGAMVAVARDDLTAIGVAYAFAQLFRVSAAYMWERRHHGFRWRDGNAVLIVLSAGVVLISAGFPALTEASTTLAVGVAATGVLAWAAVTVRPSEWAAARKACARLIARFRTGDSGVES